MVTGSIATYFLSPPPEKKENTTIEFIKKELDQYDELTSAQLNRLIFLLQDMSKEKENT